jgi:hypothetical protein
MNKVNLRLADWPKKGLTFEQLQDLVDADYESLKEVVFQLLAGPAPTLKQHFDRSENVMRLTRARL